ncbi:hypothetical protein C8Q78DRAFT_482134 [Trametes maxima]|nr:hypothetical protein C8Q78DRAFT_482134 [Trametes maxima]
MPSPGRPLERAIRRPLLYGRRPPWRPHDSTGNRARGGRRPVPHAQTRLRRSSGGRGGRTGTPGSYMTQGEIVRRETGTARQSWDPGTHHASVHVSDVRRVVEPAQRARAGRVRAVAHERLRQRRGHGHVCHVLLLVWPSIAPQRGARVARDLRHALLRAPEVLFALLCHHSLAPEEVPKLCVGVLQGESRRRQTAFASVGLHTASAAEQYEYERQKDKQQDGMSRLDWDHHRPCSQSRF